jgi:hypothetical protein
MGILLRLHQLLQEHATAKDERRSRKQTTLVTRFTLSERGKRRGKLAATREPGKAKRDFSPSFGWVRNDTGKSADSNEN